MSPIRTAIIGLSSSAKTSWASAAHLPYLLSPRGRSRYQIVALCNSSVEAAQSAIKHYNLSPETKAYGDPQSLANDDEIDLVVVCTRVDVHYATALPSAKKGKQLYVEWPLAQDEKHAKELAEIVSGRAVVGLQGRLAPPIAKIHDLVREGRIGKILSSEFRASGGINARDELPASLSYFTQRAIGGNIYTIGLGHVFDQIQYILGDVGNFKSHLHLQRPNVPLRDTTTNEIIKTVKSDVPDLIFATGTLSASPISQDGATVLIRFRRGQPFPNQPAMEFTINGEKGEIRLVSQGGTALHASSYSEPVTIQVHNYETDNVEDVEWGWKDWQEEFPIISRTVAALYDRFAEGGDDEAFASFENAAFRHEQLNGLLKEWDSDRSS